MKNDFRLSSDSRRRSKASPRRSLDELLLQLVDVGLAGCIFLVPLLMGGRQAIGQSALAGLAVLAAVAWIIRQTMRAEARWRHTRAYWLLAAGVGLLVLQLVPLPTNVLAWMAPRITTILPLWGSQAEEMAAMGTWSCLSFTPSATRGALVVFLSYGLLFTVTMQRIERMEDVERLLRWIAMAVVMMASFGLLQLLASNGKFFWFYEHPFSDTAEVAKGSFTNRNHFAHFLALGIGPLIWWLQHELVGSSRRRSAMAGPSSSVGYLALALAVVLFAGLLSLSRAGVVSIVVAAIVIMGVCLWAKTLGAKIVLPLAATGVMISVLLFVGDHEKIAGRLNTLQSGSLDQIDTQGARRTIWSTVAKAIPHYALFGAGVGSHVEVYPMYLAQSPGTEYTHAESGPLQVALEAGMIGLSLVALGIALCGFWCVDGLRAADSARMIVCIGAIAAGLLVNLLHGMVDFVWYVPGCMAVVAVLAAAACRMWQLATGGSHKSDRAGKLRRPVTLGMGLVVLGVGSWMVADRMGPTLAEVHWDRYRIMDLALSHRKPAQRSAHDEHETASDQTSLEAVKRMTAELERVVAWDPDNARAHLRLAAAYMRWFDLAQQEATNVMPLAQIRDAAVQARRAAHDEKGLQEVETWLTNTLGPLRQQLDLALRHTHRGLELCPLQGEGYLYLAELRFLEGPGSEEAKAAYINQALVVRPYDGAVLFEAGREAWLAGQPELGLDLWKRSYRGGPKCQRQMMQSLAGRLPVQFMVEQFNPDTHAMRWLHERCLELNQPQQLAEARRYLAHLTREEAQQCEGKESVKLWLETLWLLKQIPEPDIALACAQAAQQQHPMDYKIRYQLAQCLITQQQFAEAEKHLDWCLSRRPTDDELRALTRRVLRVLNQQRVQEPHVGRAPTTTSRSQ